MALFKSTYSTIEADKRDKPAYANDLIFVFLTNNSYLQEMADAIKYPLENKDLHRKLLSKLEELRKSAKECRFVFPKKKWELLSVFIEHYVDLLACIYQYRICLYNIEKNSLNKQIDGDSIEKGCRVKYYSTYDQLKQTYNALLDDGILDNAKKHTKF